MKFYFSTHNIPSLQGLSLPERMQRLKHAEAKLTPPERLFLNVAKLLVIVPAFVFILQVSNNWMALLWAALFILAYPFFLKPLQYSMCAKYLSSSPVNKQETE